MYYKITDNQLLIFNDDGDLIENATENGHECIYCERNQYNCLRNEAEFGGAYCDNMKCIYPEK